MTRSSFTLAALALAVLCGDVGFASAQSFYPTPAYPAPAYPLPAYPSYPAVVTPTYIQGVTPWGGLSTGNATVHNSVVAPGRLESLHNGTAQHVNRPVFSPSGQFIGYQQGVVWQNSLTGQWHHQLNTVTPNGLGGSHSNLSVGMAAPRNR